jgi:hypothetical protein
MKLKALLKQLSRDELNAVGERWGITVPPNGESAEFLASKMQPSDDLSEVLESLPQEQREAFHFLAIHGGLMSETELRERAFGGSEGIASEALPELARWGLVLRHNEPEFDEPLLAIPEQVLKWVEIPAHLQGYCGWLLARMSPQELGEIAGGMPDFQKKPRDPLLAFRLRNYLLDPDMLHRLVDSLPPHEQEMFSGIMKRRGHCLYRELLDPGTPSASTT